MYVRPRLSQKKTLGNSNMVKALSLLFALLALSDVAAWQPHARVSLLPVGKPRAGALSVRGGLTTMSSSPPPVTPAGGFDKCVALGAGKAAQSWQKTLALGVASGAHIGFG